MATHCHDIYPCVNRTPSSWVSSHLLTLAGYTAGTSQGYVYPCRIESASLFRHLGKQVGNSYLYQVKQEWQCYKDHQHPPKESKLQNSAYLHLHTSTFITGSIMVVVYHLTLVMLFEVGVNVNNFDLLILYKICFPCGGLGSTSAFHIFFHLPTSTYSFWIKANASWQLSQSCHIDKAILFLL